MKVYFNFNMEREREREIEVISLISNEQPTAAWNGTA